MKILLECGQEVPDFLSEKKPDGEEGLVFDDDSSPEDEKENAGDEVDLWGNGDGVNGASTAAEPLQENVGWDANNSGASGW